MRAIFSLLSLLIVLAVVGMLVKKQFDSVATNTAPVHNPAGQIRAADSPAVPSAAMPQVQNLQIQQVKQNLESSMQQSRPLPDEP